MDLRFCRLAICSRGSASNQTAVAGRTKRGSSWMRKRSTELAAALVSLCTLFGSQAFANVDAGPAAKTDGSPPKQESTGASDGQETGRAKPRGYVVQVDPGSHWRPEAASIKLTVSGDTSGFPEKLDAWLSWKCEVGASTCARLPGQALTFTRIDGTTGEEISFAAKMPLARDRAPQGVESELAIAKLAQLRVTIPDPSGKAGKTHLDFEVGVTSKAIALGIALVFICLFALLLWFMAWAVGAPGRDPLLRIISSSAGWASLAQFQVMLWTFVVAGGAVYVMVLSGTLIQITTGTLVLLGITGSAVLASQIKASQETNPPPQTILPGQVEGLSIRKVDSFSAEIGWRRPTSGGPVDFYAVQYTEPNGSLTTASTSLRGNRYSLVDLKPGQTYSVQVVAINGGGAGPASPTLNVPTAGGTVPQPIANLRATATKAPPHIQLTWDAVAGDDVRYAVEVHRQDGEEGWSPWRANIKGCSAKLDGLVANTDYDILVRAEKTTGAYQSVVSVRTGPRKPSWPDIVRDTTRAEIDVARVQMLVFTVISAVFVAGKIYWSAAIPEIPDSFVILMGISNGVYGLSKFASR